MPAGIEDSFWTHGQTADEQLMAEGLTDVEVDIVI